MHHRTHEADRSQGYGNATNYTLSSCRDQTEVTSSKDPQNNLDVLKQLAISFNDKLRGELQVDLRWEHWRNIVQREQEIAEGDTLHTYKYIYMCEVCHERQAWGSRKMERDDKQRQSQRINSFWRRLSELSCFPSADAHPPSFIQT